MARPLLLGIVALLALASAGCLEPYRAHVSKSTLEGSARDWEVTKEPLDSDGWLGPKSRETRYSFDPPSGSQPPYPAVLQVFSLRELDRRSTDALLSWTQDVVEQAIQRESIVLDRRLDQEGKRELESGVNTHWFTREGRVQEDGDIFPEDVTVRVIGEVGHDGRSDTSFVAVALAQVDRQAQCPLGLPCDPQDQQDLTTWIEIVGDPNGSVGGATSQNGFLHNLVTS